MNKRKEKVVAFGEIMLRLTPPDYTTISQAKNFIANYGGAEANVLVALSHLGHKTEFVTKVPDNQLGDSAIQHLQAHNVETDNIARGSSNLGMYFVETGFGGRPSKVLYNRKHSAITRIGIHEIKYDKVFKNATWFHLSGISLALGPKVREVAFKCLEACKKHNVKVSFDFNYRSKLWSIEEAKPYYKRVIPYVDVLFANYFDIHEILELPFDETIIDPTIRKVEISKALMKQTHIQYIVGRERIIHTATDNSMSSYCITREGEYKECEPIRFNIYDRIGTGDAFASGVIHGLLVDYNNIDYAIKFGLAISILKHTLYGDVSTLSKKEVEDFIINNGDVDVRR